MYCDALCREFLLTASFNTTQRVQAFTVHIGSASTPVGFVLQNTAGRTRRGPHRTTVPSPGFTARHKPEAWGPRVDRSAP